LKELLGLGSSNKSISIDASVSGGAIRTKGHADGGVFNREHWARFAEDNKAEAIIPLENASAMQPFVDAVANGITASLAPVLATASANNSGNLQPLYVGTLIADDRGLKELERKMQIIRIKEERRG
jgi:SLT domain-containing protein